MPGQYYEERDSLDHTDEDDDGGKWWQWLLYGLFFFGLSGLAYWYINGKEHEGGRFKLWWLLALVYAWLGKVGVTAVVAGIGALCLIVAVIQLATRSRQKAQA
jgi:hypothetical protein